MTEDPRQTRRNGSDPRTAQSRSARSGGGSSRHPTWITCAPADVERERRAGHRARYRLVDAQNAPSGAAPTATSPPQGQRQIGGSRAGPRHRPATLRDSAFPGPGRGRVSWADYACGNSEISARSPRTVCSIRRTRTGWYGPRLPGRFCQAAVQSTPRPPVSVDNPDREVPREQSRMPRAPSGLSINPGHPGRDRAVSPLYGFRCASKNARMRRRASRADPSW